MLLTDATQQDTIVFDASTPAHRPINLPMSGADFAWLIQFTDLAGNILDLTGWACTWVITPATGSQVTVSSTSTAAGSQVTFVSTTVNQVLIYLNHADAPTGFCFHQVNLTDTSGRSYMAVMDLLYGSG